MKTVDLPEVLAIEALSFSNPWSEATFRGEIQNTGISFPMIILHESDSRVAGYIIYWQIGDEVQINNVAVHPDFRRQGLGEAALKLVFKQVRERDAKHVMLEVRTSNTPALTLYRKLGFEIIGVRKGYYTNPSEDAFVMRLSLGE
jgi:ribosomal-protein-alanine N-acetyltransferase